MKRPRKRESSVAVIDIGSNSVRLVVYETMSRSLVELFNEKALCGLGREVQSTRLLAADAVQHALILAVDELAEAGLGVVRDVDVDAVFHRDA